MTSRALIAGNWKMNGLRASLDEIHAVASAYDASLRSVVDLLLCPPFTLLDRAVQAVAGSELAIGAQDCHEEAHGAYTGAIAAEMIADLGGSYVIIGHSERRIYEGETDARARAKALAAMRAGLVPIVCVGETQDEKDSGRALEVLAEQVAGSVPNLPTVVVAYEPVWAIGSGKTPTVEEVVRTHAFIRQRMNAAAPACGGKARLLYGGSIKPANADELLNAPGVDGALVGGGSLKAADFLAIARAAKRP